MIFLSAKVPSNSLVDQHLVRIAWSPKDGWLPDCGVELICVSTTEEIEEVVFREVMVEATGGVEWDTVWVV